MWEGGLQILCARFRDKMVLSQASQPFVLVPYHGDDQHFKDGLNPTSNGSVYTPVPPTYPDGPWIRNDPRAYNTNDRVWDPALNPQGTVVVERHEATMFQPARAVIWCKLQLFNYQYIHRWEFRADGTIEAGVGLGGRLENADPNRSAHIHNFYFHLYFGLVEPNNDGVQEFEHGSLPGQDTWTDIRVESRRRVDHMRGTKWRILNRTPKANGMFRSYELIPGSDIGPDGTYSSGDFWVHPTSARFTGAEVGFTDESLAPWQRGIRAEPGQLDGSISVWYCLRHYPVTRQFGEESDVLPYRYISFRLEPRDFLDDTPRGLYTTAPSSP
jgi:hypothetical protein